MTRYFILPGLGNSGEDHWQTHFEQNGENFTRINQQNWNTPDCNEWIETIDKTIQSEDLENVVLVGHSLACTTIAFWASTYGRVIKGALLVAPSDIESAVYKFQATGFEPIPLNPFSFKTIVVGSTNDPWVTIERARFFANQWNSEFINIGAAGHINTEAGYGPWAEGLEILSRI